jgi:Mor family transcriptional regulator
MGYKNVNGILPHGLIRAVQQYIDGEYVYIPRKENRKQAWGANTGTKQRLLTRNREIIAKRQAGSSVAALAEEYFLSAKAIYKIINTAEIG